MEAREASVHTEACAASRAAMPVGIAPKLDTAETAPSWGWHPPTAESRSAVKRLGHPHAGGLGCGEGLTPEPSPQVPSSEPLEPDQRPRRAVRGRGVPEPTGQQAHTDPRRSARRQAPGFDVIPASKKPPGASGRRVQWTSLCYFCNFLGTYNYFLNLMFF